MGIKVKVCMINIFIFVETLVTTLLAMALGQIGLAFFLMTGGALAVAGVSNLYDEVRQLRK